MSANRRQQNVSRVLARYPTIRYESQHRLDHSLYVQKLHTDDPPSMLMFCPVILLLKANTLTWSAQSSTVANLFNLVLLIAAFLFVSGNFRPHSVNSIPGDIELHLIFGARITAKLFIRWICAALVTAYGTLDPLGFTPATDAVEMNVPSVSARAFLAA